MPAFTKTYFHAVWAVKYRAPILTPAIERVVMATIAGKSRSLKCHLFAANSVLDHIHIALEIPPALAPAKVIGTIKGAASHEINEMRLTEERFQWQDGYGLLTFGPRALDDVIAYIENQKSRHQLGDLIAGLERTEL
jgi:putative transposase